MFKDFEIMELGTREKGRKTNLGSSGELGSGVL